MGLDLGLHEGRYVHSPSFIYSSGPAWSLRIKRSWSMEVVLSCKNFILTQVHEYGEVMVALSIYLQCIRNLNNGFRSMSSLPLRITAHSQMPPIYTPNASSRKLQRTKELTSRYTLAGSSRGME